MTRINNLRTEEVAGDIMVVCNSLGNAHLFLAANSRWHRHWITHRFMAGYNMISGILKMYLTVAWPGSGGGRSR